MRLLALLGALTAILCGVAVVESAIRCRTHADCGKGQCCRVSLRGKKRARTGVCEEYGTTGSVCHVNPLIISDHLSVSCPCVNGLECGGINIQDVPNGELGFCGPKSCKTSSDCGDDECCVNPNRPKGKRRRAAPGNVCQPLKSAGDTCLVSYGSGQPTDLVFLCPCQSGLTCVLNGFNDQPLGPEGNCTP